MAVFLSARWGFPAALTEKLCQESGVKAVSSVELRGASNGL